MMANKRVPLFAAGAAVLLIVVWYFMLWSPQAKALKAAHAAHNAAVAKVASLQSQEVQLKGLVKQIPADTSRLAQLEAAYPDNPQLDQALNLIQQAANASGVVVSTVSSPPASSTAAKTAQSALNLSLSVHGQTSQLSSFLSQLDSLPRTVVVDDVSLTGGAGGGAGTATIQARIFYDGQPTP